MAFSASDVTALERAIAQGAKKVRYKDREVTYNSIDDMWTALYKMRREVAGATAKTVHYAKFKRG